ncbi:MAG: hypothetical protein JWR69_4019 [Pedosphaera sp.]|nr:hypothetical protein [Pedosphaera sp.]
MIRAALLPILWLCAGSIALAAEPQAKPTPPGTNAVPYRQESAKPVIESATMKVAFKLGDTTVHALLHQRMSARPTMVNVHDDENTSVEAGKASLEEYGGRLIELVHSGERLISFNFDGRSHAFDPNRMFSDVGITETLKSHSRYSAEAHAEIKAFATRYLQQFALDQEPVIIALHNTVDGTFSVDSSLPTATHGANAASVNVSPNRSKFDFFYVTEKTFFDHLQARDFNVVFQDNQGVTDDGSLSVYFAKKGIPYINIEAGMQHLTNQIEMVKAVREMPNGMSK